MHSKKRWYLSFTTNMTTKNLKNFHRKKWGNKCLCINDSFVKRQKTQRSIKKHYHNPKRSMFEKKQQQEQRRRAEEGTSEEQTKDMRKYIKDLNDAFKVFCQFVVILAYCFPKNQNNSLWGIHTIKNQFKTRCRKDTRATTKENQTRPR